MLSGEDNAGERRKHNNRSNQQKSNFARAAHFFVHFFAVGLHDHDVKRPETFLWRKCCTCSRFFSLPLIFSLHWWPLAFLIFSPPLQNFHIAIPTKKSSLLFFISRSLSPFFLVEFRCPAAYFLFFSVFLLLYIPNLWT